MAGVCWRKPRSFSSRCAPLALQRRFSCAAPMMCRMTAPTFSVRWTAGNPASIKEPRRSLAGVLLFASAPSGADVLDEFLRRRVAPLRHQRLLGRQDVGAVLDVEAVAVGPVLVHAAPRIGPVVVDLAAEQV